MRSLLFTKSNFGWKFACVFFLLIGLHAIVRVVRGGTGLYDLAIYHSALLGTVNGDFYFTSLYPKGSLFYQHFDPIALLLIPFYAILRNAAWPVLPLTMAAAASLVFPAIERLGRNANLSPSFRIGLMGLLLLNAAMHNIVWYDFHPVVFALPLLLWGWIFQTEGKSKAAIACWIGAILCKENVALTVAGLGICLTLKGRRRTGLAWTPAGIVSFVVISFVVIPGFREVGEGSAYLGRYGWLGSGWKEIITTMLTRPHHIIHHVLSQSNTWSFLWKLLLPLGLLPLITPRLWPAILPEAAILLLSDFGPMKSLKYHYPAVVLAPLIIASVEALAWFSQKRALQRFHFAVWLLSLGLVSSILVLKSDGRTFAFLDLPREMKYYEREKRLVEIEEMNALIPASASVSLPYTLLNPRYGFCERELIAFLPDRIELADFIIFDLKTQAYGGWKEPGMERDIDRLKNSRDHRLVYEEKGFLVFERSQRIIEDLKEYIRNWMISAREG